ncbi:TetR/AcrR family transcriptional regulator [Paenibacillus sp. 1P07SE]|uniref:TetR/AcrR family transcriptional regulator n=1 Tax=Paenibacillus sp. 1P07SE TaxID=3132209 RepID=UPI0039A4CFCC
MMGLRERKKEETRRAILEQAARLFEAKGYQQVTTAEIARAAGIAEGTLFNYYRNKGELFVAAVMPPSDDPQAADIVLSQMSARHLTATIVAMLDQELAKMKQVSRGLLRDYFALVYSGASIDSAEARSGLFAADDRMLQQMIAFLEVQREAYPEALAELDMQTASTCIFGCVVTLLSQYVLMEEWTYEALLQAMHDQILFVLTGHIREDVSNRR